MQTLSPTNHDRYQQGTTYVYPVVSRRAGGVSIGINLNPNNACNWRCIYCQVENLQRGNTPPINIAQLALELRYILHDLTQGDFMQHRVPAEFRTVQDIAFSGNGEPTSSPCLAQAIATVGEVLQDFPSLASLPIRLITNGSGLSRRTVRDALQQLSTMSGEIWFKLDRATPEGIHQVNDIHVSTATVLKHLQQCGTLCPTWIQSCWFKIDHQAPDEPELRAYLNLLQQAASQLKGVYLYSLARPSHQPEAPRLTPVTEPWLAALAHRVSQLGLWVQINP